MTPLSRALAKVLPHRLVWVALVFCYAFGMFSVLVFGGNSARDILYIDIKDTK